MSVLESWTVIAAVFVTLLAVSDVFDQLVRRF